MEVLLTQNMRWSLVVIVTVVTFVAAQDASIDYTVNVETPLSIQAGKKVTRIKCSFSHTSWTEMQWVNQSGFIVAACGRKERGLHKCISNVDGYSAFARRAGKMTKSRLAIEAVRRQDAGDWTCRVLVNDDNVGEQRATLHVHESAEDVSCEPNLGTASLEVVCSTQKIYPKLFCVWEIGGVELVPGQNNTQTSMSRGYQSDGYIHYASNCSLLLTKGSFPFQPQNLGVAVTLYPSVRVDKTLPIPSRFYGVNQALTVQIEKPRQPKFKHYDGRAIQSVANFVAGEEMKIVCYIYHGKPKVESCTLECEFPITHLDEYSETWAGVSTVLHRNATMSMHGKVCGCYGNHLTGRTETTMLRIFISEPDSTTIASTTTGMNNSTASEVSYKATSSVYKSTTENVEVTTKAYELSTSQEKVEVTTVAYELSTSPEKVEVTTVAYDLSTAPENVEVTTKAYDLSTSPEMVEITTVAHDLSTAPEKVEVTTREYNLRTNVDNVGSTTGTYVQNNVTTKADVTSRGYYNMTTENDDVITQGYSARTQKNNTTPGCNSTTDCNGADKRCDSNIEDCNKATPAFDAVGNDATTLKESSSGSFMWLGVGAAIVVAVCVLVVVIGLMVRSMHSQQESTGNSGTYTENQV